MAEQHDFDLIVIGAGSGGVRAGRIAAGHGARVAVIRGCVPKKLLVYGASFAAEAEDAAGFGWQIDGVSHSWSSLIASKNAEIDRLEGIYRRLLENAGVELIQGWGRITGPNEVSVGTQKLTAGKILIAVGGHASVPDIEGLGACAITSNEALDLPERPSKIVILGSGFIALEFAGIFNALGSQVDLIYRSDLPLRGFDHDVRKNIAEALIERGVRLHPESRIEKVTAEKDHHLVVLDGGQEIQTDKVMAATGRVPNTTHLGLDDVGIKTDANGAVIIDSLCQSNIASVYAVGDVTNKINLTPFAIAQGHAFADSCFGGMTRSVSHEYVPCAVFSQPSVACVGYTEAEAEQAFGALTIYESQFRAMKNTLSGRAEKTYMKLVVCQKDDRVVGVHMVGPDAAEIMQGMAIALKMGAKKADFDAVIGIHPSAAEEFVTMRQAR